MDRLPHYNTPYKKPLTKRCSTIKVTHILGFITMKPYANVAVGPMGVRRKGWMLVSAQARAEKYSRGKTGVEVMERHCAKTN